MYNFIFNHIIHFCTTTFGFKYKLMFDGYYLKKSRFIHTPCYLIFFSVEQFTSDELIRHFQAAIQKKLVVMTLLY